MKKSKRWIALTSALALTGLLLVGGAVAAGGDANDPLVSLSYLNKVVIPDVIERVEAKLGLRQEELKQELAGQVDSYRNELAETVGVAFTPVTVQKGQTLTMKAGCEVMLREGSATAGAALADMTDGSTLKSGGALVQNHLYLAADADRTVKASGSVVLLVRGAYTVR